MTFMTTRAQRRARARAATKGNIIAQLARQNSGGQDLDGNLTDYERLKQATMRAAQREAAEEAAAQREKDLAPVREVEKKLNAERQEANRRARAALCLERDYPYFLEICPPFSTYQGQESDYLDAVRDAFLDFNARLATTGVTITQEGLETLAEVSEDNRGLNWADPVTFERVWGHLVDIGYVKSPQGYTVQEQEQETPAPVNPQDSFDTLLRTRPAGDPELRNAARDAAVIECQPTFSEWTDSLLNSFGYVMPLEVAKHVERWFIRNNRSFLDRTAYDRCRVACVKEGLMPRTCLTPDDISAEEMDGLDIRTTEGRRRAAQLHREGLRRAEEAQALQNQEVVR
jgi:hypothetical protein